MDIATSRLPSMIFPFTSEMQHPTYSYFLKIKEQIGQDSTLAGNNILKRLKPEYNIISVNAVRKKNMSGFSVQLLQ